MSLWQRIMDARKLDRLPHAMLLSGPVGLGKRLFAQTLAESMLCEKPLEDGTACRCCSSCRHVAAGTHADFRSVEPEKDEQSIRVDEIRALNSWLSIKSDSDRAKIVIISPAELMNNAAANALLKVLEEPYGHSLFILASSEPEFLPVTIRSRCQNISFPAPSADQAKDWLKAQQIEGDEHTLLQMASGAPLLALSYATDGLSDVYRTTREQLDDLIAGRTNAVRIAGEWVKHDAATIVLWVTQFLASWIRQHHGSAKQSDSLQQSVQRLDYKALFELYNKACTARKLLRTNANPQMVLEDLLVTIARQG